jgi:hypothetical protein
MRGITPTQGDASRRDASPTRAFPIDIDTLVLRSFFFFFLRDRIESAIERA